MPQLNARNLLVTFPENFPLRDAVDLIRGWWNKDGGVEEDIFEYDIINHRVVIHAVRQAKFTETITKHEQRGIKFETKGFQIPVLTNPPIGSAAGGSRAGPQPQAQTPIRDLELRLEQLEQIVKKQREDLSNDIDLLNQAVDHSEISRLVQDQLEPRISELASKTQDYAQSQIKLNVDILRKQIQDQNTWISQLLDTVKSLEKRLEKMPVRTEDQETEVEEEQEEQERLPTQPPRRSPEPTRRRSSPIPSSRSTPSNQVSSANQKQFTIDEIKSVINKLLSRLYPDNPFTTGAAAVPYSDVISSITVERVKSPTSFLLRARFVKPVQYKKEKTRNFPTFTSEEQIVNSVSEQIALWEQKILN